ncbi:FtsL-like putative cell division protein [Hymenobacter terrenus]|uniref:FtsL-like putative cell division protein n=1 Tax=Hymenobacter terrenus TaxID=1629124 RepID=UPI0009081FE2|nr:FtsL-like putative cell division protein [Hymenobacter terrenus]
MATNTFKPTDSPRRANVPREVPAPAPEVQPVAAVVEAPVPEPQPAPEKRPRKPAAPPRVRSSWSLFSLLDRMTSVDGLFREGLPVRYLPHLLFVMLLTLLYIGNTHYGNRMNRSIQRLKQETEDLRADYTTLKSDYMEASKQSEVARKVAAFGLVESSSPPFRITVPAGHLDAAELELMPVLTADTLAARAARDSAAAQRNDLLAGRKPIESSNGDDDSGPEIIGAPPQALEGDSAGVSAPAARAVPARKAAPRVTKSKAASTIKTKRGRATRRNVGNTDKPNNKNKVQKSTTKHKPRQAEKQAVRNHSR